jgi:hypothetical protein
MGRPSNSRRESPAMTTIVSALERSSGGEAAIRSMTARALACESAIVRSPTVPEKSDSMARSSTSETMMSGSIPAAVRI